MSNIAVVNPGQNAPLFATFAESFDSNALLRTIGLVILVAYAAFQIIALCFECFRGCFENENDRYGLRQPGRAHLQISSQIVNIPAGRNPVSEAARAMQEQANRDIEEAVAGLKINPTMVNVAPPRVKKLIAELNENTSTINVDELLGLYNEIFGVTKESEAFVLAHCRQNLPTYDSLPAGEQWRKREAELDARRALGWTQPAQAALLGIKDTFKARYVDFITKRNEESLEYHDELELVAKNIIALLKKGSVPLQKKRFALEQLVDAASNCSPRRLEESKRQFLFLAGKLLTMKDKYLLFAQQIKEEILLKNFQGRQFHVINRARRLVGAAWGLDQDTVSLNDRHAQGDDGCGGSATATELNNVLYENYTPARLVSAIHTRLAYDGDLRTLNAFFDENLSEDDKGNIGDYLEAVTDVTGQTATIITLKGVAKIAQIVGLLKP